MNGRKNMKKGKRIQQLISQIEIQHIPIVLVIFVLPLLLRFSIVDTNLSHYAWFPNTEETGDIFLLVKSRFLIVIAAICLVITLDKVLIKREKIRFRKWMLPVFAYMTLSLISALCAQNKTFAFHGCVEQYESIWVLLSYCILMLYASQVAKEEKIFRWLKYSVYVLMTVLNILGIFQFIGMDLLNSNFFKNIIVPDSLKNYAGKLNFVVADSVFNRVYMTLYNPNYVGSMLALLIPIVFVYGYYSVSKIEKVIAFLICSVSVINLIGSGSKAGMIALWVVVIIGSFFIGKRSVKKIVRVIGIPMVAVIMFIVFTGQKNVITDVTDSFEKKTEYPLEDITVYDDYVRFAYDGRAYNCCMLLNENWDYYLWICDDDGKPVSPSEISVITPHIAKEIPYVLFRYNDLNFRFTNATEDETYTYVTINGKPDEMTKADASLFSGYETLFTYRGYIWGRTIPLLKERIFIGSGPDSFVECFPQNDYVMRANMGVGFFHEILTKPHSMYLQMAVQTGVLSLLCLIGLWFCLIVSCAKKYFPKNEKYEKSLKEITGLGIWLGVIGYLICGIGNDSCVCVAPIFWLLTGICMPVLDKKNL